MPQKYIIMNISRNKSKWAKISRGAIKDMNYRFEIMTQLSTSGWVWRWCLVHFIIRWRRRIRLVLLGWKGSWRDPLWRSWHYRFSDVIIRMNCFVISCQNFFCSNSADNPWCRTLFRSRKCSVYLLTKEWKSYQFSMFFTLPFRTRKHRCDRCQHERPRDNSMAKIKEWQFKTNNVCQQICFRRREKIRNKWTRIVSSNLRSRTLFHWRITNHWNH